MVVSARIFRYWFYFRMGYGTYLSLVIGYFGNLIVIYKLAAVNIIPVHLSVFLVVSGLLGGPFGAFVGWLHVKRTQAYSTDVINQPYNYKALPGRDISLFLPMQLFTLVVQEKMLLKMGLMTPELENQIKDFKTKLETLMSGGGVY